MTPTQKWPCSASRIALVVTVAASGRGIPLPQHRDHLLGEQACLLPGEGLDEQPACAGRVEGLLEGIDDLVGGAGDRERRPVLPGGTAVDLELAVGLGDRPPAARGISRSLTAARPPR